jgi:hypothetical protein
MVECKDALDVAVAVQGLAEPEGLVLQVNGTDDLSVEASGTAMFSEPLFAGKPYEITILRQPPGHTCFVIDGSGVVGQEGEARVVCP